MDQLVQVAGALLILSAFAALQFGRMRAGSRVYLLLNLLGSSVLTVINTIAPPPIATRLEVRHGRPHHKPHPDR